MLPPNTERIWECIRELPSLGGFVLIGGSALAIRLDHRISEDLDLVWTETRLPRQRLASFLISAQEAGHDFQFNEDEAAVQEFAEGGLELRDYQQNYLVNGSVKVSFFAPDEALRKVICHAPEAKVRVATLPELFKTKCLVSAQRSKTRDWIDLYLLMRDHGFTIEDYHAAFVCAGIESQCELGLSRLCSGKAQKDDEGYAHLLATIITVDEMAAFFVVRRDEWETERAAAAIRQQQGPI